jgi:hypothetical protein
MILKRTLIFVCLAMLAMPAISFSLFAAEPQAEAPAEAKKANITMDEARVIALAKVPGGEVTKEELGRLAGKLTFFFDVRTEGQKGVDVVSINAADGEVIEVKHKTEWAVRRDAQAKRKSPGKNGS